MQHIVLMGYLGRDPEERFTTDGNKVITFSVAVSIYFKSGTSGNKENVTQWYRINAWDEHLHKMASHLKKGSSVIVCGDLDLPRIYQSKDGDQKIGLSVKATSIKFTPSTKSEPKKEVAFSASLNDEVNDTENEEKLPF